MSGIFSAIIAFLIFLIAIVWVLVVVFKPRTNSSLGLLAKIKAKIPKIIPKIIPKTPFWRVFGLILILVGVGVYFWLFPSYTTFSPDDIIGLSRDKIFVEGEDGIWTKLNATEQEAYAVLIIPDEGRTIFFGRGDINSFLVRISQSVKYPFKVEGQVEGGNASKSKVVLKDVSRSYASVHTDEEIPCGLIPPGFKIFCQWQTIDIYSGGDFNQLPADPRFKGNTFNVFESFVVPKGGMLMTRDWKVSR